VRAVAVLHSSARDGAGVAFLELVDALAGSRVELRATVPKAGPLVHELVAREVEVEVVPYRWWLDRGAPLAKRAVRPAWNLALGGLLARRLQRWRCDVVYSNTLTVVSGAIAARLSGRPHLWHVHELWGGETGLRFDLGERLALRAVSRWCDRCAAVSEAVASRLVPTLGGRVSVVRQAVSVERGRGPRPPARGEATDLVAAMVGGVYPLKRHEDAIRAVAEAARRAVTVELWVVGADSGGHTARLRGLASALGVAPQVRFLGALVPPFATVEAADVLVNCSPVEACNRATVEAMLLGVPVIAARGGGNDELVGDGARGGAYAPGDAGGLATAFVELARAPAAVGQRCDAAWRWATATFTRARYRREMEAFFLAAARADAG